MTSQKRGKSAAVLIALMTILALAHDASATRSFNGYAPPMYWGEWIDLDSHLGRMAYHITYAPRGSTLVLAEIRYWTDTGEVIQQFRDEVSIRTGNVVGKISVRFKGMVLGSAVKGTIKP